MQVAVMVAGALAEVVGWWLVAFRGRDVWRVMPVVLGVVGVAAVLARTPVAAEDVTNQTALVAGLGSGAVLFIATRIFVWVANHWETFRRDVMQKYGEAAEISLVRSFLLSLLVMVPAEELFWRGLFQGRLGVGLAASTAAAVTWLAYVGANAPSRSLPILAGAVLDRPGLVVGRRAREPREPYPLDRVDARAPAGNRATWTRRARGEEMSAR
jgi:membrane protease YdiL (CAAX protease family)